MKLVLHDIGTINRAVSVANIGMLTVLDTVSSTTDKVYLEHALSVASNIEPILSGQQVVGYYYKDMPSFCCGGLDIAYDSNRSNLYYRGTVYVVDGRVYSFYGFRVYRGALYLWMYGLSRFECGSIESFVKDNELVIESVGISMNEFMRRCVVF